MSAKANLVKAKRYFKKNGVKNVIYKVVERVFYPYYKAYTYKGTSEEILNQQKTHNFEENPCISIVVPTFETGECYLRSMIESVLNQSYGNLELILADASETECVKRVVKTYQDERIVYIRLKQNGGISENTNAGILQAKGKYIGLLDHDDLLTKDALYEVVKKIEEEKKKGFQAMLIYSDEDKCDSLEQKFFSPHYKTDYNKELLYTNNYICHFLVTDAFMMKKLLLRKEFDGAQDFDFVLRAAAFIERQQQQGENVCISHIRKILYHWRCHENSTAENPESKMYAYEAGKKASFFAQKETGESLEVVHEKHLGFYRVQVKNMEEFFQKKPDAACVGGAIYQQKKVVGGAMNQDGEVLYAGLRKGFSGYMNRAILMQNAEAVDIRNISVRKELRQEFSNVTGLEYITKSDTDDTFDYKKALQSLKKNKDIDWKYLSLEFCRKMKEKGYEIIYWER